MAAVNEKRDLARGGSEEGEGLAFVQRTHPALRARLAKLLASINFYALLVLIPLVAVPYGTVEPWWEAVFEALVFAIGALWLIEGMLAGNWLSKEHAIFLPLLVIALYGFIQTLPILPGDGGVGGLKIWNAISADPFETRRAVLKLLALILYGAMLLRYTTTVGRLRALLFTIIMVAVASAFFGILRQTTQHAEGFFLPFLKPGTGYGQFINRNHFAYLMEMALGVTLGLTLFKGVRREQVLIYLALAFPVWVALVLCNSRGGLFSMLAQVLFLGLLFVLLQARRGKRGGAEEGTEESFWYRVVGMPIFRPVLVLALLVTVFLGAIWIGGEALTSRLETVSTEMAESPDPGTQGVRRQEIWRATWKMIKDHPLAGVGFNGYLAMIPQYHEASGEMTPHEAHNDYLELLASGGVIGVVLALWFLFLFVKATSRGFRARDQFRRAACLGACAGLFAVAVHSVVDFGLHITVNALVFMALLIVAVAIVAGDRSELRPRPQQQ